MGYERIEKPAGPLYHYTKRDRLELILQDQRIRRFKDSECWFCTSLEDTLRLMELTVMNEGGTYIDVNGLPKQYPPFVPEDYVILELEPRFQSGEWVIWNQEFAENAPPEVLELGKEFSQLKKGYRGDLRFYPEPNVYEVDTLLQNQELSQEMKM